MLAFYIISVIEVILSLAFGKSSLYKYLVLHSYL